MRGLVLLSAAILLSACKVDPWCAISAADFDSSVYGADAVSVAATDAFISKELEAGRSRPAGGFDSAARALGAMDGDELAAVIAGECLAPRAAARFAAARGMSPETAETYLGSRFGVRVCADR